MLSLRHLHLCFFSFPDSDSACNHPGKVRISSQKVTSSSFHIAWSPPIPELCIELAWHHQPVETTTGPITAYILEYGESGSDTPPHIIPLSGVVEEYTVTGLKPHTEYHVKVAAENAAGRGPFCEPVLVQTAPDSEFCLHVSPVAPQLYRAVIALYLSSCKFQCYSVCSGLFAIFQNVMLCVVV